jgi:hypothetical protein
MRRFAAVSAARLCAAAGLLAILGGCGYALVGRGSNVPPDVRNVYLKPFENGTGRARVDQIMTQAVADELVTRQRFAVVASGEGADAELAGTVTGFDLRPVSFDADRRATEYEIAITARVSLRRSGPAPAGAAPTTAETAPAPAAPAPAPSAPPTAGAPPTPPAAPPADPAVLWQNDRYQFRDSYKLEASELGYLDRETPAIEAAAKKFAETMITDLLEGF